MVKIQRSIIHNSQQLERVFAGTTDSLIFSGLDVFDLIQFSKTCREAYHRVDTYRRSAYNIYKSLSPYFTREESEQFRRLQSTTGTLISGSTALTFFDRTKYVGSDLDIYVQLRHSIPMAFFLRDCGYVFHPRSTQLDDLEASLLTVADRVSQLNIDAQNSIPYAFEGIADIYDFFRGETKVQLMVSFNSPLEIILAFHTTCVMNIIGAKLAVALYPYSTFVQREALVCQTIGTHKARAIRKYEKRGWTMQKQPPFVAMANAAYKRTDFKGCSRYVGDKLCWKINLPAIPAASDSEEELSHMENLFANCWTLVHEDEVSKMRFRVYSEPKLRFAYVAAPDQRELFKKECDRILVYTPKESADYAISKSLKKKYKKRIPESY